MQSYACKEMLTSLFLIDCDLLNLNQNGAFSNGTKVAFIIHK